jgi:DNA polymerase-1
MKQLLLIDANSIIHRSFHAIPPFTGPQGQPTGALYGIASILLKLWKEEKPDYVAALFDRPEPTFRDKIYAEYKAQRPAAASELIAQIIEAHNLFEAFGVKTFEKPGYEADDLIATFAEKFKTEDDLRVVILTGDRDTFQLVEGDKLVVRTFNKGVSDTTTNNEDVLMEKYGLKPSQLVDYKALVGDSSDNIKGVPGVGPKTAVEIIKKFGTIENLYANLSGDPKLGARFGPFKKEAELSKELVLLERHVPLEIPRLEDLSPPQEQDAIIAYFVKMEFGTLLKRLMGAEVAPVKKKKIELPPEDGKPKSVQGRMF